MTACLWTALNRLGIDAKIQRQPSGYYDEHGIWKAREPEELFVRAVIQPATAEEMLSLPENRRGKYTISIWSHERLQGLDVSGRLQPDKLEYQEHLFEVETIMDWGSFGFYVSLATRIEA
jgi:hypothetical protein